MVVRFNVIISDFNDVFAFGFFFGVSLTKLGYDLFYIFSDFSGFFHDIDKVRTLSTDNKSKFDVIFFLLVFILNKETDGGGFLCKNGGKKEEKRNKDM